MKQFSKYIILMLVIFFSSIGFSKPIFTKGIVPFYPQQNAPSTVYACGHSALRSAAKYVLGIDKSLYEIHQIMIKNSPSGYAKERCKKVYKNKTYCASLYDIQMAANEFGYTKRYKGNGLRSVSTYESFLQKIKDGINHDTPAIAESRFKYPSGHFYVIVGYDEAKKVEDTILYLRHGIGEIPMPIKYNSTVSLKHFHDNMSDKQVVFVIK